MRELLELQSTSGGRDFLEHEMIFDNPDQFLRHLERPANCQDNQDNPNCLPVYAHQQVCLDYKSSVVAKVLLLRDLKQRCAAVDPEFVWIDTDRAGSDKLSLRVYLSTNQGKVAVRFAPARCEMTEPRFVPVDQERLNDSLSRIQALINQSSANRKCRQAQLKKLILHLDTVGSLSSFNRKMTSFLFTETLVFEPREVMVSDLVERRHIRRDIERLLNRRVAFIEAFNTRVAQLVALNVASKVKPLPSDFLPLFMSCPEDKTRLRLHLEQIGKTQFACAVSKSGTTHRFELGRDQLTIDSLDQQVDWSPDVTLPVLLNDNYSGMVAGVSSALYMLVFRHVMYKVLDKAPIPILIPANWQPMAGSFDSLLNVYLDGQVLN